MLSISQLAEYAGVTVRTVRHYHERGLLPEPERDHSGYRRYGAQAVVELMRIKTLAASGVPLSRVHQLLNAEPRDFADGVADVDQQLGERIAELERHRRRLALLDSPESLCLPAGAIEVHGQLRELGLSELSLSMYRDGWILLAAVYPELLDETLEGARRSLEDPGQRRLMLRFEEVFDWDPDDPRLLDLAEETAREMIRVYPPEEAEADSARLAVDPARLELVSHHNLDVSPAWLRLSELVEARALELGYPNP